MAPGGAETSVFHNTVVPESTQVDFSFDTPGMRIFKLILPTVSYKTFGNHWVDSKKREPAIQLSKLTTE